MEEVGEELEAAREGPGDEEGLEGRRGEEGGEGCGGGGVEEGEEAGVGEVGAGARAIGEQVGEQGEVVRVQTEVQEVGILETFLEVWIARPLDLIFP